MAVVNHENNRATNLTSNVNAGDTTSPLNSIPSIDAPFYLAFDATNINAHYEVRAITSKTATNVNHAALTYAHTTAEEVRLIVPAEEMNNLATLSDQTNGAWVSWTPILTNWAIGTGGSAEMVAKYSQIGKTIHFILNATLGTSGQSVGTSPTFSLPVTASSETHNFACQLVSGSTAYMGFASNVGSATSAIIYAHQVSGSDITRATITSSLPDTWVAGNTIRISGTYEAA